ncbi:MAG: response regulator [Planctomycetes bacterium]|nr:response regulator [Planctomycetota bacterium]
MTGGIDEPGPVVLVVDDESLILTVIRITLERRGCRVVCATSGLEALEIVDGAVGPLTAAFIDLNMPGMGGVELVEALASRVPDLPLVLMSGGERDDRAVERVAERVASYLSKPFRPDDVLLAFAAVTGRG